MPTPYGHTNLQKLKPRLQQSEHCHTQSLQSTPTPPLPRHITQPAMEVSHFTWWEHCKHPPTPHAWIWLARTHFSHAHNMRWCSYALSKATNQRSCCHLSHTLFSFVQGYFMLNRKYAAVEEHTDALGAFPVCITIIGRCCSSCELKMRHWLYFECTASKQLHAVRNPNSHLQDEIKVKKREVTRKGG
jgi:hypothetical protein